MAEEQKVCGASSEVVEVKDRGLFDFLGKKKEEEKVEEKYCEKGEEEVLATKLEKVSVEEKKVEEEEKKEEKHGILEKLHRSHSSSSSSSSDEEEIGEDGQKRRKKKGMKEKIKEKLHGKDEKECEEQKKVAETEAEEVFVQASAVTMDDTSIEVERLEETVKIEETPAEEKKGFLEKIKEKLPGHGQHKKPAAEEAVPPPECAPEHEAEGQKKGFLEKIKEKLPGYHKNGGEECGPTTPTN